MWYTIFFHDIFANLHVKGVHEVLFEAGSSKPCPKWNILIMSVYTTGGVSCDPNTSFSLRRGCERQEDIFFHRHLGRHMYADLVPVSGFQVVQKPRVGMFVCWSSNVPFFFFFFQRTRYTVFVTSVGMRRSHCPPLCSANSLDDNLAAKPSHQNQFGVGISEGIRP